MVIRSVIVVFVWVVFGVCRCWMKLFCLLLFVLVVLMVCVGCRCIGCLFVNLVCCLRIFVRLVCFVICVSMGYRC